MSSVRRILLTIALGTAIGAGPAVAAPAMADHRHNDNNNSRSADLAALLTGRGVVNEPADSDGWGAANVRVRSNGRVCWTYWVRNVANPDNINIYIGRRGNPNSPGDVEVELDDSGSIGQGCTRVDRDLARLMIRRPHWFNVQVDGDNGAIRGQLFENRNNRDW
jgi:hypothetical protein